MFQLTKKKDVIWISQKVDTFTSFIFGKYLIEQDEFKINNIAFESMETSEKCHIAIWKVKRYVKDGWFYLFL